MDSRNRYITAASAVLVLAVLSLIWRVRTAFLVPTPEPFEVLIFAFGCVLAVGALRSSLPRLGEFTFVMRRYRLILIILLAAPLLGLLGSSLAGLGWVEYRSEVVKEYIRLLAGVFVFLAAAYLSFIRPPIVKQVFAAIVASPLFLWLALYPSWQSFFLHTDRLRGLGNDPNYLSAWIALGVVASIVFFLWERGKVRWLWFGSGLLITPLLLWAMSRAAWFVAAIAILAVGILFLVERFSRERVTLLGAAFLGIVASLVIGFSLFPIPSRAVIATRVASPFVSDEKLSRVVALVAGGAEVVSADASIYKKIHEKVQLWSEGTKRFLESPLGFGPVYYFWYPIGVVETSQHKLDVHNLWLGVGLVGGWLGSGAWLYFVVLLWRGAVRFARTSEPTSLAPTVSFFAFLLVGFFFDIFTLIWLWLIMGLVAGYSVLGELPAAAHEKQKT